MRNNTKKIALTAMFAALAMALSLLESMVTAGMDFAIPGVKLGLANAAVFCNQTIAAIMQSQLTADLYGEDEEEKTSKMLDIENSVILVSGLVPWCIACSVPRAMLGAQYIAAPLAFFLWVVPLWWLIRNKKRYPVKEEK